ncbi:uncharacterized protein LOC101849662 [Aplysia californica]|uniref:Uncharacterized protein LOC101849662 n=1 Tax=Aplysia californica TaxID=6500 RepID=A0ABM0JCN8_APLCA|nr:uncharacterized protein LOC101849662 [Aplysia californica]XP_005090635.2 uncharacterized protein LOC101849662 [Aplysia californica]XP_005090638.2 uncharacterized protein LOC101849662 [Aplysia californica]XP_005090640.2 uncharacterized protein LOC101849662 [Aplysia californica]XP_035827752.1 uncharacterized protein LOC101849662 [Aplysia californica]
MEENNTSQTGFLHSCVVTADVIVDDFLQTNLNVEGNEARSKVFKEKLRKILLWTSVHPPSQNVSFLELTVMANYTMLCTAARLRLAQRSPETGSTSQLFTLMCSTLNRVLQLSGQSGPAPGASRIVAVEEEIMRLVSLVDSPLCHFKLLPVLGRLLLLVSVWCLYRQLDSSGSGLSLSAKALDVLLKLRKSVDESVLKEPVSQKRGLYLCCRPTCPDGEVDGSSPCVRDVVDLVLTACGASPPDAAVNFDEWNWLFCVFECERLINEQQPMLAIDKLQSSLSLPLDPEEKSRLLCLLAKCYLSQDYSQLTIQSFKAALEANHENLTVFLQLAGVYSRLKHHDLEIECLRILVKKVTNRELKSCDTKHIIKDFSCTVAEISGAVSDVTFVQAVHHFGKRCFQLQRYKEAAEQYLNLLNHLQDPDKVNKDPCDRELNVKVFIVETVEAVAMAQRHEECIALCEEFIPCLLDGEVSFKDSPKVGRHFGLFSQCPTEIVGRKEQSTQDYLCSSPCFLGESSRRDDVVNNVRMSSLSKDFSVGTGRGSNPLFTPGSLRKLLKNPRKRRRSSSDNGDLFVMETDSGEKKESGPSDYLAVRLLVCKTDCLVGLHGYTEDAMTCLLRAHNLLLDSAPGNVVQDPPLPGPSSKRQKASLEEHNMPDHVMGSATGDGSVRDSYTQLMIEVALRMGKMSLKRKLLPSVLRSCHLVLQLDPGCVPAHYLKTLVLKERKGQEMGAATDWLRLRGIDMDAVEAAISHKQAKLGQVESELEKQNVPWWTTSDVHLLSLDLLCLQMLPLQA